MKHRRMLAALMATLFSLVSSLAFGQGLSVPDAADIPLADDAGTSQEAIGKAAPPPRVERPCEDQLQEASDAIASVRREVVAAEKRCGKGGEDAKKVSKSAKPYGLVCGSMTIKVKTKFGHRCDCDPAHPDFNVPLDLIEPTQKTVACVSQVDYRALLNEAEARLNAAIAANAGTVNELLLQYKAIHAMSIDNKQQIFEIRGRLGLLERRMDDGERRLDTHDDALAAATNIRLGVDLHGIVRGDKLHGGVGLAFGIDGHLSGGVGLMGLVRGNLVFETNADRFFAMGAAVGPIFDLNEERTVRLYTAFATTQWLRSSNTGNGLDGHFLGASYGAELGFFLKPSRNFEIGPYVALGYGPNNHWNDEGRPVQARALAFVPGLTLNITTGIFEKPVTEESRRPPSQAAPAFQEGELEGLY